MMWSFYDPRTGAFSARKFSGPAEWLEPNTPADHEAIAGDFDHLSQCVDAERLARDRAAALEQHNVKVEAARVAFVPTLPGDTLRAAKFKFCAAPDHIVDWQPPAPSVDHEWNAETKRWVMRAEVVAREAERARALAEIELLEHRQPRALRELALGVDGARERVQAIEDQIAALRVQLV